MGACTADCEDYEDWGLGRLGALGRGLEGLQGGLHGTAWETGGIYKCKQTFKENINNADQVYIIYNKPIGSSNNLIKIFNNLSQIHFM